MGKLIAAIAIIAAAAYVWHQGWIGEWLGAAVDSGADSVRSTQRSATKGRPIDAPPAEQKP